MELEVNEHDLVLVAKAVAAGDRQEALRILRGIVWSIEGKQEVDTAIIEAGRG